MQPCIDPAPIVLFAFARPDHTRRTLAALAANELADRSDLIVYSDAARNSSEADAVAAVRALAHETTGFRSVTVVERKRNFGLARNIAEGVTEVINRSGQVIVLEDDIVTSPHFLGFMNAALERYTDESRVWHISGFNYPIDPAGLGEAFFWRVMNCWGWATWADRWRSYSRNPGQLVKTWDREKIRRFNLDGAHDFWEQVVANNQGKRNTWAIFWYATIFEHDGLCLNPARSLARNIGHDGTGEHCDDYDPYGMEMHPDRITRLPDCCEESALAVERVSAFYRSIQDTFLYRLARQVRKLFTGGRNIQR